MSEFHGMHLVFNGFRVSTPCQPLRSCAGNADQSLFYTENAKRGMKQIARVWEALQKDGLHDPANWVARP